jgi:hypothetical protein
MIRLIEGPTGGGASLCQLKITLKWSQPAIWRRVVVRADLKLNRLHDLIQRVMPWNNSHLHQFVFGHTYYGLPDPESMGSNIETLNEKKYTLADLAPAAKKKFIYEYDFGDSWEHEIIVEKLLPPDADFKHPICLGGANACPPDDCGGIHGYHRLLEILADRKHPEHQEVKEWLGIPWDPSRFDLTETNTHLKRMKA